MGKKEKRKPFYKTLAGLQWRWREGLVAKTVSGVVRRSITKIRFDDGCRTAGLLPGALQEEHKPEIGSSSKVRNVEAV